jgi:signal transduction histidine kinase
VLDFARPIRFELTPTDLNALCRESAAAAEAAGDGPRVGVQLDAAMPLVAVDAERLRLALVNLIVNARHAVNGYEPAVSGGATAARLHAPPVPVVPESSASALVSLTTHRGADRATIVIADRGAGIAPADLGHIFDPYFTTKRGGTGLGLPIAKNIVEGLGGTIGVSSTPNRGTEICIDLPLSSSRPS